MNRVLKEFWKQKTRLNKAREKYLIAKDRQLMGDTNHYMNRLNQVVCKAMKRQYKEQTKEYQKFLRSISNFSFT